MTGRTLFKYVSRDRLATILQGGQLWFASPATFNDPFDCSIAFGVDYADRPDALVKLLMSVADDVRPQLGEPAFRNAVTTILTEPAMLASAFRSVLKQYRESGVGVSCFSRVPDSILMWSHYADSHRGACLEFDPSRDPNLFKVVEDVQYTDDYPQIRMMPGTAGAAMKTLATTKAKVWEYEREVRVFKDKPGLHPIRREALVSVALGCMVEDSALPETRSQLAAHGWAAAALRRARRKRDHFALELVGA